MSRLQFKTGACPASSLQLGRVPPPVYNWGVSRLQFTTGAGHRRGRARRARPMRSNG